MPTYTYSCEDCDEKFELFRYIKDYEDHPSCPVCDGSNTSRSYVDDALTQSASVKKMDSELKTIGDLAMRNSERMSDDQKSELYQKHNSYKEDKIETKPLPKGMSYMKKPPKPIWPGSKNLKKKRRPKHG
jgi:putative FmdB family regulatory protein